MASQPSPCRIVTIGLKQSLAYFGVCVGGGGARQLAGC